MKHILLAIAFCLFLGNAYAQEGRQHWKPEFTARCSAGFVTSGPAVTAGARLDNKRTLGVWIGQGDTYIDAEPANIHAVQTAAYMRRYIHLGSRDIVALYGECIFGCEWIYHIDGGEGYEIYDPETGTHYVEGGIDEKEGDVGLYAGINAGIRLRIVKNLHLFLGPTLTTNTIGLHAGIGF